MIRNPRIANRTKIDGIEWLQDIQPVCRHHFARFQIVFAAPWEILEGNRKTAVHLSNSGKYFFSFGNDLGTDSVPRNHRNIKMLHSCPPSGSCQNDSAIVLMRSASCCRGRPLRCSARPKPMRKSIFCKRVSVVFSRSTFVMARIPATLGSL